MVFYGEYTLNLTEGGRLVLPKKIRELLGVESFILTKGFGGCLSGYDNANWNEKTNDLSNMTTLLDNEQIARKRYVFSGANVVTIDDQGRFVVPKSLLDFMDLKNEQVVVVGVGDHFEIWSTNKWNDYLKNIDLS